MDEIQNVSIVSIRVEEIAVHPQGALPVSRQVVDIKCPECGESVRAVSYDGRIKGFCANSGKYIQIAL